MAAGTAPEYPIPTPPGITSYNTSFGTMWRVPAAPLDPTANFSLHNQVVHRGRIMKQKIRNLNENIPLMQNKLRKAEPKNRTSIRAKIRQLIDMRQEFENSLLQSYKNFPAKKAAINAPEQAGMGSLRNRGTFRRRRRAGRQYKTRKNRK